MPFSRIDGGAEKAASGAKAAAKRYTGMAESEARLILNVKAKGEVPTTEVLEAQEKLTTMNDPAKGGSAYINQKIKTASDTLLPEGAAPEPPKEPPKE